MKPLSLLLVFLNFSSLLYAETFIVTTTDARGAGSLFQAFVDARNSDDDENIIEFDQSTGSPFLTTQTLIQPSPLSWTAAGKSLTVNGPSSPSQRITLSGDSSSQILIVGNSENFIVHNLSFDSGGGPSNFEAGAGAISGKATFVNCRFTNNEAQVGGAMRIKSGANVTLRNCSFRQNISRGPGGAIQVDGNLLAINSTFSNNIAADSGGAIILSLNGSARLQHCTVVDNQCGTSGNFFNSGGGIACRRGSSGMASLVLTHSLVAQNTDIGTRGFPDIWQDQNGIIVSEGYNFIGKEGDRTVFGGGEAFPLGNETDLIGTNASPLLPDVTFIDDGIHAVYTPAQLFSPVVNAGSRAALSPEEYGIHPEDQLGNDRRFLGTSDIGAVEFSSALTVTSLADTMDPGTLRHAISVGNITPGTAIIFDENLFPTASQEIMLNLGELFISEPMFIVAPAAGVTLNGGNSTRVLRINTGAVSPTHLENIEIRNADSTTSTIAPGAGAGIYVHGEDTMLDLFNISLKSNNGVNGAGLGVNNANCVIDLSHFSSNVATASGGAIFVGGTGNLSIDQTNLFNNSATNRGGAIYIENASLNITRSTINGNDTEGFGGGLNLNVNSESTITNCTLIDNNSGRSGGGIFAVNTASTILTSCTISENIADFDATNNGVGGGLRSAGSSNLNITHCLIEGNTDRSSLNEPDVSGIFISSGFNLIGIDTGASFTSTTGDLRGTTATPINSGLEMLSHAGGPTLTAALAPNSPAIDAGDPGSSLSFVTSDQRGLSRRASVFGTEIPDIGAYEYQEEPYDFWADYSIPSTPLNPSPDRSAESDFDGDLIKNGMEYILATDPTSLETNPIRYAFDFSSNTMTFTFPLSRKVNPFSIISETSTNLLDWDFTTSGISSELTSMRTPNRDVQIDLPLGDSSNFFRLRLFQPE